MSEPIARYIFGGSMAIHYLLTHALPGLAFGLMLLQGQSILAKQEEYSILINLLTRLFGIQFSLAIISGLTLETDLHQNWSGAGTTLIQLINHPMGRSAFGGFMLVSGLLFFLFSFKKNSTRLCDFVFF